MAPLTGTNGGPPAKRGTGTIHLAACGDVHCHPENEGEVRESLADACEQAEALLLAGDLTTHGRPEEGEALARICADLGLPVFAVLGNHDFHCGQAGELTRILSGAGVTMLEGDAVVHQTPVGEVGIVGAKGFVGGFSGSHLPDFGEPLLRQVYAETSAYVEALDRGLREIAHCPIRVVLLHYSPCEDTLAGEQEGIKAFLGSDRLAAPILEHAPDLVVHGHAHAGRLEGAIGEVPVFNVSGPVIGRGYWLFEFSGADAISPIH
jgi:Icc-related predicted phosphoesterase